VPGQYPGSNSKAAKKAKTNWDNSEAME
jgi:hypothetical protein